MDIYHIVSLPKMSPPLFELMVGERMYFRANDNKAMIRDHE